MEGLIIIASLLLLAFPVIAIVALVKAIGARDQLGLLERRIVALEAGQPAAPSAMPAEPAPVAAVIEPSPIIEAPPELAAPEPTPSAAPVAAAAPPSTTLEERFGTKWVVWVGGLALALGGIFLVRYSIEQGLIGPEIGRASCRERVYGLV